MTFDEFDDLSSDQMLALLSDLYPNLWMSIYDPLRDAPDYDTAKSIIRMMAYGIIKFRNVAAYFTADFNYSSIEETQAYAREILAYIEKYGKHTPLPVYREFTDWVDTTEQIKKASRQRAQNKKTTVIEAVEKFLATSRQPD